jgi:HK97 family phage portal protein
VGLFTRSIRPPVEPNDNTPEEAAPGTVGPPSSTGGDPNGLVIEGPDNPGWWPPRIVPSAWSGWPDEWLTPEWGGQVTALTDTAWTCLDLNASLLATMPPYLVGAASTLDTTWITNPDPDLYTSWEEFAKQLFWDFMLGEAFVIVTARYATGWPARFHVVPPWAVKIEIDQGERVYTIGDQDVSEDILHVRYQSRVGDARGHGPLEAGRARLVAASVLNRYASSFAASGGIPSSILTHPEELTKDQAADLQAQWVAARMSRIGQPAVLSGGVTHAVIQVSPKDAALVELSQLTESRIAVMLGVPPFLVGLPSGGDSMTYSNVTALFDYHWRASLRPKAQTVMAALSGWALPRGTLVELNRDSYVQPDPLTRAQTYQILNGITDPQGNPVLSVPEIRAVERLNVSGALGLTPQEVVP